MAAIINGTKGVTTAGLYTNGTFSDTYSDGVVIDYSSPTGRIIVGTADGIGFYNNGIASPVSLGSISSGGAWTMPGDASINGLTVGKGGGAVAGNTALGANALAGANSGTALNTAVGYNALVTNTTGATCVAVGYNSLYANTSGQENTAIGTNSLQSNTTGGENVGVGRYALQANTTASNNTAVGYQAGYTNSTGAGNTFVGQQSGYNSNVSGNAYNTCVGHSSGYGLTTGVSNTFIGSSATASGSGSAITTGSKNTIIGAYSGNQGGLDIRTASNYIVLSDGDGNPYAQCNTAVWTFGIGGTASNTNGGAIYLNGTSASGYQAKILAQGNGTTYWQVGTQGNLVGSASTYLQCQNTGGGVYLNGASATAWTAVSDERQKENLDEITDGATKVASLRAVIGNYKWDEEKVRRPFLIAQDVQAVLPEAVNETETADGTVLGLAYTDVIPLLVAAIKELKAEIDALKGAK